MTTTVPAWKWWFPVPLWKVFVIGLVTQVACALPLAIFREVSGWNFPMVGAAGAGALLMFFWVRSIQKKLLAKGAASP